MEPIILLEMHPEDGVLPLSGMTVSEMTNRVVEYLASMSDNETVQSEFDRFLRAEIDTDRLRMVLRLAGEA